MAKLPSNVKLVARTAAGFGIVQSVIWVSLNAVALASYLNCGLYTELENGGNSSFGTVLQDYYFLHDQCPNHVWIEGTITSYELHIWAATAIATSGLWLIASICLLIFVNDDNMENVNINLYSWSLLAVVVASTDLALGVLLGLSFEAIGYVVDNFEADGSQVEWLLEMTSVRMGTIMLMMVALRGFILLAFNLTLVTIVLYQAYLVNGALNRNEHTIHSLGPLHAYHGSKNHPEPWNTLGFEYDIHHGGQLNRAYSRSENDREAWQLPQARRMPDTRDDSLYGRSLTRSETWHNGKTNQPTRPFSYLEEPIPKNQAMTPPSSINAVPPWKRRENLDGPRIHVPSPDYSPPQSRQPRLKSALKSTVY